MRNDCPSDFPLNNELVCLLTNSNASKPLVKISSKPCWGQVAGSNDRGWKACSRHCNATSSDKVISDESFDLAIVSRKKRMMEFTKSSRVNDI